MDKLMNITITLDYEVFFGRNTGSVENTILIPTKALCDIAKRQKVPLVFFVDVGFLSCLQKEGLKFPGLLHDYSKIMRQLEQLVALGHELQLHVHPHWEKAYWDGNTWKMDMRYYTLHDFKEPEVDEIIQRYTGILRSLTGGDGVFAFRAGGWAIRPFEIMRGALLKAGINIDSSVIVGAQSEWESHGYDFTDAPVLSRWFFDDDPLIMNPAGAFLELPIANFRVSPTFYWRFALAKKFGGKMHQSIGDGVAVELSLSTIFDKLFHSTICEVSTDNYKSSFLVKAAAEYERLGRTDFVIMGHPKACTRYSLQQIENFIVSRKGSNFVNFSAYRSMLHREAK
jgi:hypothetical protein